MTEPLSVVFQRRAIREAEAIDEWWRSNRPSAPDLFVAELEAMLGARVHEQRLEVLALWHATRGTGPGL